VKKLLLIVLGTILVLTSACFPDAQNVTEDGEGLPELGLEFPETATAGSTETAALTITNPGPGEMESLVVAFSRLGDPALPPPIVDVTGRNRKGAVENVTPEPTAVSPDGITYTFEGLAEEESVTIEFELVVPFTDGPAGNAVLVYEGQDPNRARGVRLRTEVAG